MVGEVSRLREMEMIISMLKRATNYKLMQKMPSGRYYETVAHDEDWEKFRQAIGIERSLNG